MAIVTADNQRLYFTSWMYNASRITSALAKIVENHDGRVKYGHPAIISDRTLSATIREAEDRILKAEQRLKEVKDPKIITLVVNYKHSNEEKVKELQTIVNDPIPVTHTTYISFVLDDFYYHFSMDDNPFFPFHYLKTPIKDGVYSADIECEEDKKEWLYDCFFKYGCSQADVVEAANLIFNMLLSADAGKRCPTEYKRISVPNTYDGGYHFERVPVPERKNKINF